VFLLAASDVRPSRRICAIALWRRAVTLSIIVAAMLVTPIACLHDNYAYLLRPPGSTAGLVVDPSEADPVLRVLEESGLSLAAILNTHHHPDHTGGNQELAQRARWAAAPPPSPSIYGHASDRGRIPGQTHFLEHGQEIEIAGLRARVLHVPGHTRGAVAYAFDGAVFTGDTLFAAGCGRLFEGTAADMYRSLNVELAALPDDTRVYCGHEYTANNLRFAATVEPGNDDVRAKAARVAELRARGEPTVPSTMGEERRTNPFMRCQSPEILQSLAARLGGDRSPVAVLAAVRAAKDAF
jgi:hydroxyacylglutathione hydrolase